MYAMLLGLIEIFAFGVTETPTAKVEAKAVSPADASVMLVVDNGINHEGKRVYSRFSGTAISPSLIVTCWHGFREKGVATANGKPVKLLKYDVVSDVALVECEHGNSFINVASEQPKPGELATAYGYEGGEKLGIFQTRILRRNRFNDFPNLTISGAPKYGRSGGGLFNQRGELIGVCSSFIQGENAGLYCGLEAVQKIVNPSTKGGPASLTVAANAPVAAGASQSCPDGRCPLLPKQGSSPQPPSKGNTPTLAPPEPRPAIVTRPLRSVMIRPVMRVRGLFSGRLFSRLRCR